ncbi:MAG: hypothetical protein II588_04365 [Paludibacteraceae bacterium]|nr:hypothetical protein [Paludibacteraceae bacterium]
MMKNKVLLFAFSAVSLSALVACGSSSSGGTGAADVDYIFSSYSEMNKSVSCNYSNEGKVAYLTDIESAVICSDGYWEDYDLNAKDSTSESKNIVVDTVFSYSSLPSCNYYREDSVVYVRSLQINLVCDGYSWREEALTLVPTSVSTMKALPTCVPSIAGAIVYVNGIGEDVICSEKRWVEYRHWLESSSSMNSSSSSYDDDDESSSSYKTDEEEVLGKCSAENNGMLAYDSNHVLGYSTNYYYYCDGTWESWEAAPSEMIDTLGWESAEDGIFRAGDYSYKSNRYRDLPVICNFNGEGGSVYFVHDGSWRIATDMEVCVLRLCNNDHAGDTELLDGYIAAYTPVDAELGLHISPLSGLLIELHGGYALLKNQSTLIATTADGAASFNKYGTPLNAGCFSYAYSDYGRGKVGGLIDYHYRDIIHIKAWGDYFLWSSFGHEAPGYTYTNAATVLDSATVYDRAKWTAGLRIDGRIDSHWSLYSDNRFVGSRLAMATDGTTHTLKPIIEIGLGCKYEMAVGKRTVKRGAREIPNLEVFLQLDNIIHRNNEIYYGYQTQGIQFLLGAAYKF